MLGGDKPVGLSGTHCCELTSPAHSSPGEGSFLASEHQLPHTAFASRSPGAQQSLQPRCSARHWDTVAAQHDGGPAGAGPQRQARAVLPALGSAWHSGARRRPAGIRELSASPRSPGDRHRGEKNSDAGRKTRRNLCAQTFRHAELADGSAHRPDNYQHRKTHLTPTDAAGGTVQPFQHPRRRCRPRGHQAQGAAQHGSTAQHSSTAARQPGTSLLRHCGSRSAARSLSLSSLPRLTRPCGCLLLWAMPPSPFIPTRCLLFLGSGSAHGWQRHGAGSRAAADLLGPGGAQPGGSERAEPRSGRGCSGTGPQESSPADGAAYCAPTQRRSAARWVLTPPAGPPLQRAGRTSAAKPRTLRSASEAHRSGGEAWGCGQAVPLPRRPAARSGSSRSSEARPTAAPTGEARAARREQHPPAAGSRLGAPTNHGNRGAPHLPHGRGQLLNVVRRADEKPSPAPRAALPRAQLGSV